MSEDPNPAGPLVARFGRLGDSVLLQPLLHALRRRYGAPCTLLARGAWPEPLYRGHPDVASIFTVTDAHRPLLINPQRWRIIAALRRRVPTPVYVCEPEPRTLQKINRMLALAKIDRSRCVFISDAAMTGDEHWIDRLIRFGLSTPPAYANHPAIALAQVRNRAPMLRIEAADRDDCAAWLATLGIGGQPPVLVQPSNKRMVRWSGIRGKADDKWWPTDRWAQLILAIRQRVPDAPILLCGGADEAAYLHSIDDAARCRGSCVVAGQLPLRRLMVLADCARSMITVDTGPAHVAAAMGCPLVVLFGNASPQHWQPRSSNGSAVQVLGGPLRGGRVAALAVNEVLAAWSALPERKS